jgi:hypothetical protein
MEVKAGVFRTDTAEIWLENNEVLWVRIREGAEIDLKAVKSCFDVYKQICGEKKLVQIIDARATCSMTAPGKKYSALHSPDFFVAHALITELLSVRMLVNFYNKTQNHTVPYQVFRTEEEAREWLKQYIP